MPGPGLAEWLLSEDDPRRTRRAGILHAFIVFLLLGVSLAAVAIGVLVVIEVRDVGESEQELAAIRAGHATKAGGARRFGQLARARQAVQPTSAWRLMSQSWAQQITWPVSDGVAHASIATAASATLTARAEAAAASVEAEMAPGHEEDNGALSEFVTTLAGVQMPRMIYGTAMRKERTETLVLNSVRAGCRGYDISGNEPGVGAGLSSIFETGVARDTLFVQTKVALHYDPEMSLANSNTKQGEFQVVKQVNPETPIAKQVDMSIAKSLSTLGLDYIDSLVIPFTEMNETLEAWAAMEDAVRKGTVRQLGVSNFASMDQLRNFSADVSVKPAVVLGEAVAVTDFERDMQTWCKEAGITFQSFWTLDANVKLALSPVMQKLAIKYGVDPSVLFYRWVMGRGGIPIIGISNMKADLSAFRVPLAAVDAEAIDGLLTTNGTMAPKGASVVPAGTVPS